MALIPYTRSLVSQGHAGGFACINFQAHNDCHLKTWRPRAGVEKCCLVTLSMIALIMLRKINRMLLRTVRVIGIVLSVIKNKIVQAIVIVIVGR